MLQSIFTKPLFINPQAYLIIPELASLHNYTPYDFDSTEYSFKVITSGRIEGELLKANDDCILHLDLYSVDGNCVLGEFYLNNSQIDQNSFNLQQNGNIVTINFSSIPSPIEKRNAMGLTTLPSEDAGQIEWTYPNYEYNSEELNNLLESDKWINKEQI